MDWEGLYFVKRHKKGRNYFSNKNVTRFKIKEIEDIERSGDWYCPVCYPKGKRRKPKPSEKCSPLCDGGLVPSWRVLIKTEKYLDTWSPSWYYMYIEPTYNDEHAFLTFCGRNKVRSKDNWLDDGNWLQTHPTFGKQKQMNPAFLRRLELQAQVGIISEED